MKLLRPEEAAEMLGIGEDTLREMRKAGELPYINVGRGKKRETPRYDVADLLEWIAERKTVVPQQRPASARTARSRSAPSTALADFRAAVDALSAKRKARLNERIG